MTQILWLVFYILMAVYLLGLLVFHRFFLNTAAKHPLAKSSPSAYFALQWMVYILWLFWPISLVAGAIYRKHDKK